jgi:hypothetical protein
MRRFSLSWHCRSRVHCAACRRNPAWRGQVGAPEECPDGVTDDLSGAGQADRLTICRACQQACVVRELLAAARTCGQRAAIRRMVSRPGARCPAGRWPGTDAVRMSAPTERPGMAHLAHLAGPRNRRTMGILQRNTTYDTTSWNPPDPPELN